MGDLGLEEVVAVELLALSPCLGLSVLPDTIQAELEEGQMAEMMAHLVALTCLADLNNIVG